MAILVVYTRAMSIGRGLAASSVLAVILGSWLIAQLVPPGALGLWAKYQFAKRLNTTGFQHLALTWPEERGRIITTPEQLAREADCGRIITTAQELALTPGLRTWSRFVTVDVRAGSVFALAHTIWVSLALALASALFGQVQYRRSAPIFLRLRRTDQDTLSHASLVPPNGKRQRPPVTQPDNGNNHSVEDLDVIRQHQELTVPDASSPADLAEGWPAQAAPAGVQDQVEQISEGHGTCSNSVWGSEPSPEPSPSNGHGYYTGHWGLQEMPFDNTPNPKYYFPTPNHEEALQRLLYGVEARKGAVILTGEIGCGKTLLSRTLIHHLLSEKYDTALIADPTFEEAQLLQEVLYQLGVKATGSELELRHRLNKRLMDNTNRGLDTILIIDEAQAIHEDQMFEKLRLMLNFQLDDRFLLTLVLLGQPELKTRFQRLNPFYQRVAIRYHLCPFAETEVEYYIRFRLAMAGCKREIFTPDACSLIFQASDGIPRRVNTLCDLCLLLGSIEKAAVIDRKMVGRVAVNVTHGIGQDHRITQPVPTFRSHQVALPT